jgi:DNA (cytosine-5)-methyltransferase 1
MKYVDLFAGCGGLSLGLERAGFILNLSLEKSDMACETFYHNFIKRLDSQDEWDIYKKLTVEAQFEKKVLVSELATLLKNEGLMKKLKDADLDLVAGGPPCQGFSLAGRRNPLDVRNKLPWEFLEFVEITGPKFVVIENVVGISRRFNKHDSEAPFDQLCEALRTTGAGYVVQPVHVNAVHYGVPENRPRLMIIGARADVANTLSLAGSRNMWRSNFTDETKVQDIPVLAPKPCVKSSDARTVADALYDFVSNNKTQTESSKRFLADMSDSRSWHTTSPQPKIIPNQKATNHQETTIERFKLYQYLTTQGLASNILNIPYKYSVHDAELLLFSLTKSCTFPAVSPDGTVLAKDQKNFLTLIFKLKTKKHSQRALNWDRPSPTVVTLPDDYIHPSEPRIFTVRELARFQSFPDSFEFRAKQTTGSERRRFEVPQYSQVGNAVPPLLGYAVGKNISELIRKYEKIK